MKRLLFVLLFLLLAFAEEKVAEAAPEEEESEGPSSVLELDEDNYDTTIAGHDFIMVKFFAPWCGHCKKLAPIFKEAAEALKEKCAFAEVNCDDYSSICQKLGVRGYPTLKFFVKGKPLEYKEERSLKAIKSFVARHTLPPVSEFTTLDAAIEFAKDKNLAIIGQFKSKDVPEFKGFSEAADELHADCSFAAVLDPAIAAPSIQLRRGEEIEEYENDQFHKEAIVQFYNKVHVPLLEMISQQNAMNYIESKIPVAFVFTDPTESYHEGLVATLKEAAKELRGVILFTTVNVGDYARMAGGMGIAEEKWPALSVEDKQRQHFVIPPEVELTKENIVKHCQDVVSGALSPTIRSEPVPEDPWSEDHIYQLVGKSFQDVVNDPTKDVLVKFYAPWCGHCKKLAPEYVKLAAEFESKKDKLLIAELNMDKNDAPASLKVTGFPTLILFPATKKDAPITYKGARTFKELKSFLLKNAELIHEESEL